MVVLDSLRPLLVLPPALPRLLPSFLSMYSDELDSVTGNLRDSAKGSNDGYDVAFPLTLLGLILRLGTVLLGLPVRFPLGVDQLRVVLPNLVTDGGEEVGTVQVESDGAGVHWVSGPGVGKDYDQTEKTLHTS